MNVPLFAKLAILVAHSRCASAGNSVTSDLEISLHMQRDAINELYHAFSGTGNRGDVQDAVLKANRSCIAMIRYRGNLDIVEIVHGQLKAIAKITDIPLSGSQKTLETARSIVGDIEAIHRSIVLLSSVGVFSPDEKNAVMKKIMNLRVTIICTMDDYSKVKKDASNDHALIEAFERNVNRSLDNVKGVEAHISSMYRTRPCSYGCQKMIELIGEERACIAQVQEMCKSLRSDSRSAYSLAIKGLGEQLMRIEDAHHTLSKIFRQLARRLTNAELAIVNDEEKNYNPDYRDFYDTGDIKDGETARKTGVFAIRDDRTILPLFTIINN